MSLSTKIIIGLVLGVLSGLFFGELCAPLHIVGDIYVKLMQMSVTPYIILALIYGIASLNVSEARRVAMRVVAVVLLMWGIGVAVVLAMQLAFPDIPFSSYYTVPADARDSGTQSFVDMFIPSNIFHSLAEELVPSIIVFCMFVGAILMRSERKASVLELLKTGSETIEGVAAFIAQLTPIGVFAMAASNAATMTWQEFTRLQVYLVIYIPMALFVALWAIPALVSAVLPISWLKFLKNSREPLLVAFATQSAFVALPLIGNKVLANLQDVSRASDEELTKTQTSYIDIILPIVFALPTIGTMFILFFLEYTGWAFANPLKGLALVKMIVLGVPALFADYNSIPFLLRELHLPSDSFGIYLVTSVLTENFQALLHGVSIVSIVFLVVAWTTGQTRVQKLRLIMATAGTLVLGASLLVGLRSFLTHTVSQQEPAIPSLMTLTTPDPQPATVIRPEDMAKAQPVPTPPAQGKLLSDILQRRILRVAYSPASMPWSYFNAQGELVGYDIELAHMLARDMNCALEFIPIDFAHWQEDLEKRRYDIAMVSFAMSPERIEMADFTSGHRNLPSVFVVRDYRKADFKSRDQIRKVADLRIAVLEGTNRFHAASKLFPNAKIVPLKTTEDFFKSDSDLADAWYTEAGKGYSYALLYPAFDAVNDEDDASAPEGYPIPKGESSWQTYLDAFLKVQRENGSENFLFEKYILGKHPGNQEHRWSVIRDVLHWVD